MIDIHVVICDNIVVSDRARYGCKTQVPSTMGCSGPFKPDDYICYGLIPYHSEQKQTVEDYTTAFEKDDPVFYSSCFFEIKDQGFGSSFSDKPPTPSWLAGDDCLSCDFITKSSSTLETSTLDW